MSEEFVEKAENINIETEMKNCYLDYSMSVIAGRALPDTRDGLKPVQRRIIYAMHREGLASNKKHSKCAGVVGEVLKKYHPHGDCLHGDTLVYDCEKETCIPIKTIFDKGIKSVPILAFNETSDVYIKATAHSFRIGQYATKIYTVHFSNGYVIKTTGNHPLLTDENKWVKVEELIKKTYMKGLHLINNKNAHGNTVLIKDFVFVQNITVEEFTEPVPMYDFTVDEHENMIIPIGVDSGENFHFVVAHNSSVYEALVRQAQDFNMRMPLVDGQGNFGSLDGDPAAAYRYCVVGDTLIETKNGLTEISQLAPDIKENSEKEIDILVKTFNGEFKKASKLFHSGKHDVIRIVCENGFSLTGSCNHPILIETSMKLLKNVKIGDYATVFENNEQKSTKIIEKLFLKEKENVYSIKVDSQCHTFVGNGFINHNTEARLTKVAESMLMDIDKETVDFMPNFDETIEEPKVLPTRVPNLLVNGSSGIAVGMATNIPPHNLGEVIDGAIMLLDNPQTEIEQLCTVVKGPDFPTASKIIGLSGIRDIYTIGRGSIIVRASSTIETEKNGRNLIVFTDVPYMVNKATLVEKLAELVKDKKLTEVSDIRDESNREGIRVVVELKRGEVPQVVLNKIYKFSRFETSFGAIMLSIVKGQPKVLNLKEMLAIFLEHREDVVTKRTKYELKKAEEKLHVLEGLKLAVENLDEVIKIIRASKNSEKAKEQLQAFLPFTDIQVQAVLDMKLHKLTGLELDKIITEYKEIETEVKRLKDILADKKKIIKIIKNELLEIKEKFNSPRRTEIIPGEAEEMSIEDLVADEDVVISLTHNGYIKRSSTASFREQRRGGKGSKGMDTHDDDFVESIFTARLHDSMLFLTNKGNIYSKTVYELPEGSKASKGRSLANFLELNEGEKIATAIPVRDRSEGFIITFTKKGLAKKTKLELTANVKGARGSKGIAFQEVLDGDEIVVARLTDGKKEILIGTSEGQVMRCPEGLIRSTGRGGQGVRAIKFKKEDDEVVSAEVVVEGSIVLTVMSNGFGKRTPVEEFRVAANRGGKGAKGAKVNDKLGKMVGLIQVNEEDSIIMTTNDGKTVKIKVANIRETSRTAGGVTLMNTGEGKIISVSRISKEADEEETEHEETEEPKGEIVNAE